MDYNLKLPNMRNILNKHMHILESSSELWNVFTLNSIFPAFRRSKNLRDILAPSTSKIRHLEEPWFFSKGLF